MKNPMKAMALSLLLLSPITLASCDLIQSTSSKANLGEVSSQASTALNTAKAEAEKALNTAKESASKAISSAQESGAADQVQKTWDGIKTQFDTLIEKASSPENKQKITDIKNGLEQKFTQLQKDISSNKDVKNTATAIGNFFSEVTAKLSEVAQSFAK